MNLVRSGLSRFWISLITACALSVAFLLPGASTSAATAITIANPSFETGSLSGWANTGTSGAAYVQTGGYSGTYNLAHWNANAYTAETTQTVSGLTNGTYTLTAWVQNGGGQTSVYMVAKNFGSSQKSVNLPVSSSWTQVSIGNIAVTNGQLTFGLSSNAKAGNWSKMDNVQLSREDGTGGTPGVPPTSMKVGGDITYRNLVKASGGKWAYSNGQEAEVLDILKDNAFNLARIRIYNQPGNTVNYNGTNYHLQAGYQDLNDAVNNAIAAKQRGMTLFVSLHYSDFWTNPSIQKRPNAWTGYTQAQLEQATYDYTYNVMTTLKNNGVAPEYISIGNEINNAIMDVNRGTNYYKLLKKGYDAVKAVNSSTKVVIHLTEPTQSFYTTWINDANSNGLAYDIIGVSIYPFWTNLSITQMASFVNWVSTYSGKRVMVCEVGYPWTLTAQRSGETTMIAGNGLDPDGPENYGATPAGQLKYMKEFFRAMYNTGKVDGIAYWDPIWLDVNGAGWVAGEYNQVEDTTFFDYGTPHKALQGLQAFYAY